MQTLKKLPGEPTHDQQIDALLRVDHAGEYGARRIYAGQLAVLKDDASADTIRHMAAQEEVHLKRFEQLINQRRARPSALMPLWHIAGFALGAGTALMGPKAAMACTVAVESVIGEHYAKQIESLGDDEKELRETLQTFHDEEMEHHDTGLAHQAEQAPFYEGLSLAIRTGCRAAIWLAKRV